MQEIHWLGSVTDDLVYLPSGVLPMMLLRPPNIPSSKFKSKLGSTLILPPVCPETLQQKERQVAESLNAKNLKQNPGSYALQNNIPEVSQSCCHDLYIYKNETALAGKALQI